MCKALWVLSQMWSASQYQSLFTLSICCRPTAAVPISLWRDLYFSSCKADDAQQCSKSMNNHGNTAKWYCVCSISQIKSFLTIMRATLTLHCHSLVECWLILLGFSILSAFALHCWTLCVSGWKPLQAFQSCAPLGQLLHLFLPPSSPLQLQWPWGHQQRCECAPMHPLQYSHPSVTTSGGFFYMSQVTQHTM